MENELEPAHFQHRRDLKILMDVEIVSLAEAEAEKKLTINNVKSCRKYIHGLTRIEAKSGLLFPSCVIFVGMGDGSGVVCACVLQSRHTYHAHRVLSPIPNARMWTLLPAC